MKARTLQTRTLVGRSLRHYWRTNLAVVAGVGTAVAVLAGALLVGDSVRASLRELFLLRLGRADHVISAAGFFREKLAAELARRPDFSASFSAACPMIQLEGLAIHEQSGRRAARVQVYGVDERFWSFHGRGGPREPSERRIMLSAGLATELGSSAGDSILVRVQKPSDVPGESLHGRKDDAGRAIRFTAGGALSAAQMGEFAVRPQQGTARAVFIPLQRLQKDLQLEGRINTMLVSEAGPARSAGDTRAGQLERLLRETFALEDIGIRLRALAPRGVVALESAGGFVSDAVVAAAGKTAGEMGWSMAPVLTYLANSIRAAGREIPYSLVTATTPEVVAGANAATGNSIVLNDWAARELGARPGDAVTLDYYVWHSGGRLETRSAEFRLAGIVPLAGGPERALRVAADPDFAPQFPGITDSDNLGDWDPPFPLDLKRIRPQDERYWDLHRTTPKAFIPIERGQELWQSRFGKVTSLRLKPAAAWRATRHAAGAPLGAAAAEFEKNLTAAIDPATAGLSVYAAAAQGREASRGATDFGEYFVYFSFFLVASALLLAGLFFKLGVEQRLREIGTLRALGFDAARIRRLFLAEGLALAICGTLLGLAGAVAYSALIMLGLRTWWVDAVGTQALALHVTPAALALGALGGLAIALAVITGTLRAVGKISPRGLLAGARERAARRSGAGRAAAAGGVLALLGLLLVLAAAAGRISQVAGFFGAGTLALGSFLSFLWVSLAGGRRRLLRGSGAAAVSRLGFRNAGYRPAQSLLCIALIASATFILVAVDAFRRDPQAQASLDRRSGSGGFPLVAESLAAIFHDPNSPAGRESLNLARITSELSGVTFVPFRLRPGEDASCLNLYQPSSPRILGASEEFIRGGRFAFERTLASTAGQKQNPWLLLDAPSSPDVTPVIVDANSMTYVLHKKLGDEIIVDRNSARPVRLRLVAALSDSLFQRELIISEKNFIRLFPDHQGYRFFLLDAPPEKVAALSGRIEDALSDYGFDIVSSGELLAGFHRVENTYLSTFQMLGGLGLLLGTVGLAAVLLRNVLERRRELALLRAVGYRPAHLAAMVVAENALLLFFGVMAGALSALVAIGPAFFSRSGRLPAASMALLLVAVVVVGLAASVVATRAALRSPLLPALRSE